MKTILATIRFPSELYQQLKSAAQAQNASIDQLIIQSVRQALQNNEIPSIENQLVLNQIVSPAQIFPESGLLKVNGIFYRYLTENNAPILNSTAYLVIGVTGNILTIRAIKK